MLTRVGEARRGRCATWATLGHSYTARDASRLTAFVAFWARVVFAGVIGSHWDYARPEERSLEEGVAFLGEVLGPVSELGRDEGATSLLLTELRLLAELGLLAKLGLLAELSLWTEL